MTRPILDGRYGGYQVIPRTGGWMRTYDNAHSYEIIFWLFRQAAIQQAILNIATQVAGAGNSVNKILVDTADRTGALGGPWNAAQVENLDITQYLAQGGFTPYGAHVVEIQTSSAAALVISGEVTLIATAKTV